MLEMFQFQNRLIIDNNNNYKWVYTMEKIGKYHEKNYWEILDTYCF